MRFLDHDAVNALTGPRSRVQRWRDIKADKFPPPAWDYGRKRWPDTEITSFLRWRLAVSWSRLSEQLFRVDKWSVCRG
jgi:hypothetical protein